MGSKVAGEEKSTFLHNTCGCFVESSGCDDSLGA